MAAPNQQTQRESQVWCHIGYMHVSSLVIRQSAHCARVFYTTPRLYVREGVKCAGLLWISMVCLYGVSPTMIMSHDLNSF